MSFCFLRQKSFQNRLNTERKLQDSGASAQDRQSYSRTDPGMQRVPLGLQLLPFLSFPGLSFLQKCACSSELTSSLDNPGEHNRCFSRVPVTQGQLWLAPQKILVLCWQMWTNGLTDWSSSGMVPRIKSCRNDNRHLILTIGRCQPASLNVHWWVNT